MCSSDATCFEPVFKKRRLEQAVSGFVCIGADLPSQTCTKSSRVHRCTISNDVVLRRCARSSALYKARETFCGRTVLIAPARLDGCLEDLASVLKFHEPLNLGKIKNIDCDDSYVGNVRGFASDGSVKTTMRPCIAELWSGETRTGVLVVVADSSTGRVRCDLPSVRRVFDAVACTAICDL